MLSIVIPPDTSAEIVIVVRLLFVPRLTEAAIPAIVTVSRSPKVSKSIAGPSFVAAVVASGSTTPVTSTVSTLVSASTDKETNELDVNDSTSPPIVTSPLKSVRFTVFTSVKSSVPSAIWDEEKDAGPVIVKVRPAVKVSPSASISSRTKGIAAPSSVSKVKTPPG